MQHSVLTLSALLAFSAYTLCTSCIQCLHSLHFLHSVLTLSLHFLSTRCECPGWKNPNIWPFEIFSYLQTKTELSFACFIKLLLLQKHQWMRTTLVSCNFFVKSIFEPRHEISNNVVCETSKNSDQPAHSRSLIRAFSSRLKILLLLSYWQNNMWSF